jgi:DNA polymerase IV
METASGYFRPKAFPEDIPLTECEEHIRRLAEKVWAASNNVRQARTAVLKVKTKEFTLLTRSLTPQEPSLVVTFSRTSL